MKPILAGTATLMLLSAAQAVAPEVLYFLPLGGSPIAEIGIVLATCVAAQTIHEFLRR
jgi:hypothetical protein